MLSISIKQLAKRLFYAPHVEKRASLYKYSQDSILIV